MLMRFERIWKLEKRVEKEFEKMGRINRSWQINWDTSRSVLGLDWVWRLVG